MKQVSSASMKVRLAFLLNTQYSILSTQHSAGKRFWIESEI
ncbi:hypothetical protein [Aulosira sp. FACHB-615]|nr:hypothetical protein [Aulosira sp. FACHB-615]